MQNVLSKRSSFFAATPLILFGMFWLLSNVLSTMQFSEVVYPSALDSIGMGLAFASVIGMGIVFVLGWKNDFPAWTLPSIGFVLLLAIASFSVSIPAVTNGDFLGFWALVPLLIIITASVLVNPKITPLKKLLKRFKTNYSNMLLAAYGIVPLLSIAICDEVYHYFMIPVIITVSAIWTVGLLVYLRSEKKQIKVWTLIGGTMLPLMISYFASSYFWNNLFVMP
jgi:predicted neutral ceramidase superfamily lipid hydrolase